MSNQKHSSRKRGHLPPSYTKQELIAWACAKHIPSVCKGKRNKTGGFIWRNEFIKEGQTVWA